MFRSMRILALSLCVLSAPACAVSRESGDPLVNMFTWWNAAFKEGDGFTKAAFERHFTPDATLELNGELVIRGTGEWEKHFRRIKGSGRVVEVAIPFKHGFRSGDRVYTYHVIRSRNPDGSPSCMLASGHAELRGDKIASISLVRHPVDYAKETPDSQCWQ